MVCSCKCHAVSQYPKAADGLPNHREERCDDCTDKTPCLRLLCDWCFQNEPMHELKTTKESPRPKPDVSEAVDPIDWVRGLNPNQYKSGGLKIAACRDVHPAYPGITCTKIVAHPGEHHNLHQKMAWAVRPAKTLRTEDETRCCWALHDRKRGVRCTLPKEHTGAHFDSLNGSVWGVPVETTQAEKRDSFGLVKSVWNGITGRTAGFTTQGKRFIATSKRCDDGDHKACPDQWCECVCHDARKKRLSGEIILCDKVKGFTCDMPKGHAGPCTRLRKGKES